MRIIIGREESQVVTKAFRDKGHEAWSCDIIPTSGKHPEWHLYGDIKRYLNTTTWDMGIFFPPCTYLTISANKWYKDQTKRESGTLVGAERREARLEAIDFFMRLMNAPIGMIAIENPIGVMSTEFRKPDQVIQPWMFGHGETKATCLWLKNLPRLLPMLINPNREQRTHKLPPSKDRAKLRSKTFQGIADAMANQWG